jgi:hypothetical protein
MSTTFESRSDLFGIPDKSPQSKSHPIPAMDPNDLIDTIVDAIDYAEIARDDQGLIKARRLLNNDLRQAIDVYVQVEVHKALQKSPRKPNLRSLGSSSF